METMELIKIMKAEREKRNNDLYNRKHNINQHYFLAKLDFKVIDNYNDSIQTLDKIIKELEDLQERIIKRNRERIV